jgi:radical SAM protein with 4Fe4S-binding SPASM domain
MFNRFNIAVNDAKVLWNILRDTGEIPASRKSMVTLELCSVCNLACPLCPTGTGKTKRENRFMPEDMVNRIISLTSPVAQGYVLGMWGEPLLYPHLEKVLAATALLPAWTSTNLNLSEKVVRMSAKWEHFNIVCAIDTLNRDEYANYRVGGDYDKVLSNLDMLVKGNCQVYPQFLVDADNDDDAPFIEFAEKHNISKHNVIIKVKRNNFTLDAKGSAVPGKCHAPYNGLYFNSDGYLYPCCNDVKKELQIKHISKIESLEELLCGDEIVEIRKKLAQDKNIFASCRQCRGETFWNVRLPVYTDYLKNLLPWHKEKRSGPQHMPFEE